MKQTGFGKQRDELMDAYGIENLHRACVVYAKLHNPSYRIQVREGEATG